MGKCLLCNYNEQQVNGLCWDCYEERISCKKCGRFSLKILMIDDLCERCTNG